MTRWDLNNDWSDASTQALPWSYRQGTQLLPHWAAWQQLSGDFPSAQPAWVTAEIGNTFLPAWFKVTFANGNLAGKDWQAGDVVVHTSSPMNGYEGPWANLAWTCPYAGTFDLAGSIWTIRQIGRSQHWTLYKNSTWLASGNLLATQSRSIPCNVTAGLGHQTLAANDVISLEIARDYSSVGDYVGVNFTITAYTPLNTPPTISPMPNQTTHYNSPVSPIGFTVGDLETPAANLTVTATSYNPVLVPNDAAHRTLGGSGTNRTLIITPATGHTGSATIQVDVNDGALTNSVTFVVTVLVTPQGTIWDLKNDWSENSNGPRWTYREGANPLPKVGAWISDQYQFVGAQPAWARSPGGNNFLPAWFKASQATTFTKDWQIGDIVVHANEPACGVGNGQANVVWTSPINGQVDVSGAIWIGRDIGRGDNWSLRHGTNNLTSGVVYSGDPYSSANPCRFSQTSVTVTVNDTISLWVEKNPSYTADFAVVNLTVTDTTPLTADSDNDGLPDAWELQYFGNLAHTAAEDYDGDGLTNLQEYQAGTDPNNRDSDGDGLPDSLALRVLITTPRNNAIIP